MELHLLFRFYRSHCVVDRESLDESCNIMLYMLLLGINSLDISLDSAFEFL